MHHVALAIETSNPALGSEIALARCNEAGTTVDWSTLVVEPVALRNDDAVQAAHRACTRMGVAPKHLRRIAVSVGPGGFTSVRVAVTSARMIAEVCGASLVGVPSSLVAALGWQEHAQAGEHAVVALASKGESAFITCWRASSEQLPLPTLQHVTGEQGSVMTAQGLQGLMTHLVPSSSRMGSSCVLLADEFLPSSMRDLCVSRNMHVQLPKLGAASCLRAGLHLAPCDPLVLSPLYPREPEAVTKWRELKQDKLKQAKLS